MKKQRTIMPPPRPEVIRIRYRKFLAQQERILKDCREACRKRIEISASPDSGSV